MSYEWFTKHNFFAKVSYYIAICELLILKLVLVLNLGVQIGT
jgi:hypothetical protein